MAEAILHLFPPLFRGGDIEREKLSPPHNYTGKVVP